MNVLDLELDKKQWEFLSKQLEKFLHKPIREIEQEYRMLIEQEKPLESDLYDNQNLNKLSEYYKSTNRYLYELSYWEASLDKQDNFKKLYLFLKQNKINNVLDFGGGIGGLSLYLNQRKIKCDYLDIGGVTFKFAKWRFKSTNAKIRMFDSLKEQLTDKYQVVVAYDVLEHLPNLEENISKIASILENSGFFLNKSTFSGGGLHLKKNEIYTNIENLNDLLVFNSLNYYGRLKNSFLSDFLNGIGIHANIGIRISKKIKYGGNILIYKKQQKPTGSPIEIIVNTKTKGVTH